MIEVQREQIRKQEQEQKYEQAQAQERGQIRSRKEEDELRAIIEEQKQEIAELIGKVNIHVYNLHN